MEAFFAPRLEAVQGSPRALARTVERIGQCGARRAARAGGPPSPPRSPGPVYAAFGSAFPPFGSRKKSANSRMMTTAIAAGHIQIVVQSWFTVSPTFTR